MRSRLFSPKFFFKSSLFPSTKTLEKAFIRTVCFTLKTAQEVLSLRVNIDFDIDSNINDAIPNL